MKTIEIYKSNNPAVDRKTIIRDRPLKSLIKAISWRVIGTFDTMLIAFLITGKPVMAISIGGIEVFTKIFLYYLHERAWELVRWGRMMVVIRRGSRNASRTVARMIVRNS